MVDVDVQEGRRRSSEEREERNARDEKVVWQAPLNQFSMMRCSFLQSNTLVCLTLPRAKPRSRPTKHA